MKIAKVRCNLMIFIVHVHSKAAADHPKGSQKVKIGEKEFDSAHIIELLKHMKEIDWEKVHRMIGNNNTVPANALSALGMSEIY